MSAQKTCLNWQKNVPLAPLTTYRIGGAAKCLVHFQSLAELEQALLDCKEQHLPFYVLGKGSNTLFDDRGFNGAILVNDIDFCRQFGPLFEVGSGVSFPWLGFHTAKQGFSGLEFAAGIPGTVGGAIFMNAGAHGQEIQEVLHSVVFIDSQAQIHHFQRDDMKFDYRTSFFHALKGVIVSAKFELKPCFNARKRQKEKLLKRQAAQPLKDWSCGCVFRNHPEISIGKLIDEMGLKGLRVGGAEVSLKHGNFIVNKGGASAQDVLGLIELLESKIFEHRGIRLIREVRYIPYEAS